VSLSAYRRWRIESRRDVATGVISYSAQTNLTADAHWWAGFPALYSPGAVVGRRSAEGEDYCGTVSPILHTSVLSRLTFIDADGSESELVDIATDGEIKGTPGSACPPAWGPGFNRGRTFRSKNGESITFVSDANIYDNPAHYYTEWTFVVTGWLYLPNGTRYRVENSRITEIRDRNGNRTFITYDGSTGRVTQVTDPIKRTTTFQYNGNTSHTITYPGTGGTNRSITIHFRLLGESNPMGGLALLDGGYSLQTYNGLFGMYGGSGVTFNPRVLAAIELPNGHYYSFRYNSYGEVSEFRLPTGGIFRYLHGAGGGTPEGVVGNYSGLLQVYRRVAKREVYPDGVNREGYIDYSNSEYATPETETSHGIFSNSIITLTHRNHAGIILRKEKHWFFGGPSDEQNVSTETIRYAKWRDGRGFQSEILTAADVVLQRTEDPTVQRPCEPGEVCRYVACASSIFSCKFAPNDPRVTERITTVADVSPNQLSKVTFSYDKYNNVTTKDEYNWGSGGVGSILRRTSTSYATSSYDTVYLTASGETAETETRKTAHLRSLPTRQYLYEGTSTLVSDTVFYYDGATPTARSNASNHTEPLVSRRGNLTSTQSWVSGSTWITTSNTFDVLGNVTVSQDGRNNATTYDFTDNFSTSTTLGGQNAFAFPRYVINALNHYACIQYDYYLGRPTSSRRQSNSTCSSGVETTAVYSDTLDRLTQTIDASNTAYARKTTFSYSDTPSSPYVTSNADRSALHDGAIITTTIYDGLGRTTEERAYEGSGSQYITTVTQYDGRGRVWRLSNPYRPASEALYWTATSYDERDRPRTISHPDGSSSQQDYLGNRTESIDPAGKRWHRFTDALGRLTQVTEAPATYALNTYYSYTAHDKLRTVCQGGTLAGATCTGGLSRTYSFDGLGRMLTASNPESGTISYVLDEAGNVLKATDARGVVTCVGSLSGTTCTGNEHDALNRVKKRRYSDGTPEVTYVWDTNFLGELTSVSNSNSSTAYSYHPDAVVSQSTQTTNGTPYVMSYDHYISGPPKTVTYPSGRVITYAVPDVAGRLTQATGVKSGEPNRTYVSNATYASHGPVKRMQLGGLDRYYQAGFNARLQATSIQFGTNASPSAYLALSYGYGTTNNNGNMLSQTINAGGTVFSQSFGYDDINRLKTFTESATAQTYCYDRYGNRAMLNTSYIVASALTPQVGSCTTNGNDPNLPFTNNRTNIGNQDASGNVRWDGATAYTFDAENRITNSTRTVGSISTIVNYKYDGDGRRVRVEVTGGASTSFVYDAGGKLLAEYNSQNYPESGTRFRIGDHLGSTRLLFDLSGNVLQRFDYLPFGEELLTSGRTAALKYGVASTVKQRFTGQMRDGETHLDYFHARYLSPNQGRFMSIDPGNAGASTGDPQSWNAYSYTINNPLLYVDPDGLAYRVCDAQGQNCSNDVQDGDWEAYLRGSGLIVINGKVYDRLASGQQGNLLGYVYSVQEQVIRMPVAGALRTAGDRAARDVSTFVTAQAVYTGAFLGVTAGPAVYGYLASAGAVGGAVGQAGVLRFGKPTFDIIRDNTGRVHGTLPRFVPRNVSRDALVFAASELRASIQVRLQNMVRLGEQGNHGIRIAQEQRLLKQIERQLGSFK
jgi:RHS repeat-associated protein